MSIPVNFKQTLDFIEKGTIVDGVLELPCLYSMGGPKGKKKLRFWQIFVGIFDENDVKIPIDKDYINRSELPEGAYGGYWTLSGQVEWKTKPKPSAIVKVLKGRNTGKKNFTTPFTQAILQARTDFEKKITKGHVLTKKEALESLQGWTFDKLAKAKKRGKTPWRVFPMALHNYKKYSHKISCPCYVQPKYDGVRFIIVSHPAIPENHTLEGSPKIDFYTRKREQYDGYDYIVQEAYQVLKDHPGLHLDGELWKKGYSLQDISGASRKLAKSDKADIKLEFHVFDCFYIEKPDMPFSERFQLLKDIFTKHPKLKYLRRVPVFKADSKEKVEKIYQKLLKAKYEGKPIYEGAVIRSSTSKSEFGISKEKRSYQTLKLKPRPDGEWKVIDFKDGKKGKEVGAIVWICEANGKKFSVTPNWDYETRYAWFEKMSEIEDNGKTVFENGPWNGAEGTINYSILSKDGLPQQPKFLNFRKKELNVLPLD